MKINELLEELRKNYLNQEYCYEQHLEDFVKKHNCVKVKDGLDVDKHRWYETSIIVYRVDTDEGVKFIGVRACTDIKGEEAGYSDIGWTMRFMEMIEKQEVTYVTKP